MTQDATEKVESAWWKVAYRNLVAAILPSQSLNGEPWWFFYVPILAGTLAAVAGVLTVKASYLANDANYQSNQAVLMQSQASDTWSQYEADSIKARELETAIIIAPTHKAELLPKETALSNPKSKRRRLILRLNAMCLSSNPKSS
jgi:hypothetical protein